MLWKKAPHVCSCRAFLRRNSCRAASLSQFLWGGAFWKKPLSRYLLRLRLVLRRAGGNGGLGDVVRMIADVLDDPENIHIDKARFGVAFLLVQPLDVAVAEFDFEAAQLPGDGGDFARLVGVVVDGLRRTCRRVPSWPAGRNPSACSGGTRSTQGASCRSRRCARCSRSWRHTASARGPRHRRSRPA